MKQNLLKGLSEEQIAKIKACKNSDEILKVAKEEGIELNDEQLEAISGGCGSDTAPTPTRCPLCGSTDVHNGGTWQNSNGEHGKRFVCGSCFGVFHTGGK